MRGLIDIQSDRQSPVALESGALLVAGQRLERIAFACGRSAALDFLLLSLAFTRDEYLVTARLALLAGEWSVARRLIRVTAYLLLFATWLRTCLAAGIFTLTFAMTLLTAEVYTALEFLATHRTTADVAEPALLIFESFLAAHAHLRGQKRAFWAGVIVLVAVVSNLRMSTGFWSFTWIATWRRLGATWKWRLQDSPATVASNLFEDGFSAGAAGAFMTELFAYVVAALQQTTALPSTDVLGLVAFLGSSWCGSQWSSLLATGLPLMCFTLTSTAVFVTHVPSAV